MLNKTCLKKLHNKIKGNLYTKIEDFRVIEVPLNKESIDDFSYKPLSYPKGNKKEFIN